MAQVGVMGGAGFIGSHLAALPSVPLSLERLLDVHEACATGTPIALDAAHRAGVRRFVLELVDQMGRVLAVKPQVVHRPLAPAIFATAARTWSRPARDGFCPPYRSRVALTIAQAKHILGKRVHVRRPNGRWNARLFLIRDLVRRKGMRR